MPLDPEAQAVRLLLITLALEQAGDTENLLSLLNERQETLAALNEFDSLNDRTRAILGKVVTSEKRLTKVLEGRRTVLVSSLQQVKQGKSIAGKYRTSTESGHRRVA